MAGQASQTDAGMPVITLYFAPGSSNGKTLPLYGRNAGSIPALGSMLLSFNGLGYSPPKAMIVVQIHLGAPDSLDL
jgi:hypothetical protein